MPSASKASSSKTSPVASVAQLEAACTSSPFNPNPLLPLLDLARHADAQVVHKAVWALHRVFVRFINEDRVGGISEGARVGSQRSVDEDDVAIREEGSVKSWVRDRLMEYVEVLGGLMRDIEPALRVRPDASNAFYLPANGQSSALPLLFSLLGPLSSSVSQDRPIIHTPYFRIILRALLAPTPSLRGAKPRGSSTASRWLVEQEVQVEEEEGVLPADIIESVDEEFWAKYDDIRWALFKEAR
jgi:U3 small nucleolar RNA-associated protein 19